MKKNNWKGIVLAGGIGTRLYPITKGISKQLLHIYDKPMVYYPISVLMLAGIRDILLITSKEYINNYKQLLGNGSDFGVRIQYKIQKKPDGIANAINLGKKFIGKSNVCLILGDNIFHGQGLLEKLETSMNRNVGATVFGYQVKDPERYGVVEFRDNKVKSLREKPKKSKSNFAVTGLYFYDNKVLSLIKNITPSKRGELEITDLNKEYLKINQLYVEKFGRGFAWLDTGTHESLLDAAQYIQTIENRQGLKVACLEEIAFRYNWISKKDLVNRGRKLLNTDYGNYILEILKS
tara:strand:+ start:2335 stop:3213 length:879 start_codon:yes stop_codon:yes gene_type:complete